MNHQERERVHQTSCHHIARDRESPHLWQKWGTRGRGTSLDMKHNPVPLGAAHRGHILVTPLHRSAGACSQRTFLDCYRARGGCSWNHKAALRPHLASCTRGVWKVDFYVVILNVFLCWSTVGRLCMSSPDNAFSQRCPRASIYL